MHTAATLLLVAATLVVVAGRRQTPLRDPLEPGRMRSAECQFGRQMKELGSTWFADLGPPFGVMYCIKCECVAVQKKRRIVARTHCRNIKSECPQPSCEDPVLMPGRCCKTCPDDYSPDMMDPPPSIEDEDKNMKDYAALLTGRTSLVLKRDDALMAPSTSHNSYDLVATGRFTFHRRNLYYSFYTPEAAGRPRALQFVDVEGNILEEQALVPPDGVVRSAYQNATGKVCGVWRRVPRDYRRLIREQRLYVWLIWGGGSWPEQSLSGQVARYKALSSEMFSSLLQPAEDGDRVAMHGAGGTAIVSTKHGTPSVHISLVFNGVFAPDEIENVPVVVRLEHPEKDHVVFEEEVRVPKPAHELNVVEVRSPVSVQDLRHLTRGHLVLSVASRRSPRELRLQGRVGTRVACEIFQTPLSSVRPDPEEKDPRAPEGGEASGLAWLYVGRDGALAYSVQVAGLPDGETPYVTVSSGRGRRREDLEDLTPSFRRGWANGSVGAPGPRELEELYAGELSVDVAVSSAGRVAVTRGRLQARPVADARDSPAPALLTRPPGAPGPLELVAMAWTAVLDDCSLVYEVVMSGPSPHDGALQLYLESVPLDLPGAPRSRRLLEEFRGDQVEGFDNAASPGDLMQLEAGVSSLEVVDAGTGAVLLRGRIAQVKLPLNCLPQYRDNDVPADPQTQTHGDTPPEGKTCFHEGAFREDGSQWRPRSDPCLVCSCLRGHTRCDAMVCPPLRCPGGEAPVRPSSRECCPVCNGTVVQPESNTSATRGCYMGGLFYPAGRSWHPYLPPNGFDTCTVCSCAADSLEVHYHRTECPPLACDEKLAVRPDKKACCRQCPPAPPADEPGDQPLALPARPAPRDVLASGGCRGAGGAGLYGNGEEWHPRVSPHGEIKCVTCSCKDGKTRCERKRCTRSACRAGQASDGTDDCCPLCKRHRRHHKPPANS
ncbi:dorsal-ventral patterning protein Sog [Bacillus rossius redtenbacheri]|uniref:dorsal-ventral patterning protein Sog n=1 Tax=Bacillus rossius redtenbacheri TaxID=93214 RepID=UPI002FDCFC24